MLTLFLLLFTDITLFVASTQYHLQYMDVKGDAGNDAVGAIWGDSANNLYFSQSLALKSCKVRKIDSTGRVSTVVGAEETNGSWITGLYGDSTGDILYLSQEYNNAIWKHTISSNTTVKIGGSRFDNFVNPLKNGVSALSSPMNPTSLFLSSSGMLYFCDSARHRVRAINTENQIINTIAGNDDRTSITLENVPATSVWLFRPTGVWGDSLGFIFIADRSSNKVRRVNPAGIIATFAGNGRYAGEWTSRSRPDPRVPQSELGDNGPPTLASLEYPYDVKGDKEGNLYIAESKGCRVRMISSNIITTIIGSDKCRHATYDVQFQISAVVNPISSIWVVNKETIYFLEWAKLSLATSNKQAEEGKQEKEPDEQEKKAEL